MNASLTDDERTVLGKMLDDSPHGDALRRQVACAMVTREWTGCGFFTDFQLPPETEPLPLKGRVLLNAKGRIGGELCEFILFIDDGRLTMLECFTYEGSNVPEGARVDGVETLKY